ncbi:MAG: energy transducer TonB [Bacteroidota bacterium]
MSLDYNPWNEVRKNFLVALYTQVQYPADARVNKIQGKVLIGMEIDEAGEIQETFVGKGLLPSIDKEALYATRRAAQKFKLSPAKQDGAPVPITLVFPVTFKLE